MRVPVECIYNCGEQDGEIEASNLMQIGFPDMRRASVNSAGGFIAIHLVSRLRSERFWFAILIND